MNSSCNDQLSVGITDEESDSIGIGGYDELYDLVSKKFEVIGIEIDSTKPINIKKVNGENRVFATELVLEAV